MSNSLLKRRDLLKGMGAAGFLARPLFRDSLVHAAEMPKRFLVIYFPGGVHFGPGGDSKHGFFTWEQMLASWSDLRDDVILLRSMPNRAGKRIQSKNGEPHHAGMRTLLTGDSSVFNDGKAVFAPTPSIDQAIAAAIGGATVHSSLQFGVFGNGGAQIDQKRLCFLNSSALPPVDDPAVMFKRLFPSAPAPSLPPLPRYSGLNIVYGSTPTGSSPPPAPAPTPTAPAAPSTYAADRKRSILDHLRAEITALKTVAGTGEQQKLDQHMTSIRELEKKLPAPGMVPGATPMPISSSCKPPALSAGMLDIPTVMGLQFDLLYQAMVCDSTRVASFQILHSAQPAFQFPWLGVPDVHHALEHGDQDSAAIGDKFNKVQTWFTDQIAGFLRRLKATPEGSSNMLDNSLVFVCTELTQGDHHTVEPLTGLLVGRAGGAVRPGRTLDLPNVPHNNLLLGMAQAMGVNLPSIGDVDLCTSPVSLA